jgi:prevent-host-death family protein
MEKIGVKEFRDRLGQILSKVEKGQVIRILRHGREVVELRPINVDREDRFVYNLAEKNLIAGGSGRVGPVRTVKNRKPETPVSDLIVEERR